MIRALLSGLVARVAYFSVPLGLFAVLAVGLHVGTDRFDDDVFLVLDAVDRVVDRLAVAIIGLGSGLGFDEGALERARYTAIELIDVERKEAGARGLALVLELFADLLLAAPLLAFRRRDFAVLRYLQALSRPRSLLALAGPLAALLAALSGIAVIAREVQVLTHATLLDLGAAAPVARWLASGLALLALALVSWRLGLVVVVTAARWAEARMQADLQANVPPGRRFRRGLTTALVALPVATYAFVQTVSEAERLRALLPW